MENINIAQFLSYFGSWYPVIVPCVALLCIIAALIGDWLRVWCIAYVDENENAPYKRYVKPFVQRLIYGKPNDSDYPQFTYYMDEYWFYCGKYWKWIVVKARNADLLVEYIRKHGEREARAQLGAVCLDGKAGFPYHRTDDDPSTTGDGITLWGKLTLRAIILMALLTFYKFLPTLATATGIGYVILRLARFTVRLGKKLKAHIADPNAHKQPAAAAEK